MRAVRIARRVREARTVVRAMNLHVDDVDDGVGRGAGARTVR
jgi:hypothetical protein